MSEKKVDSEEKDSSWKDKLQEDKSLPGKADESGPKGEKITIKRYISED